MITRESPCTVHWALSLDAPPCGPMVLLGDSVLIPTQPALPGVLPGVLRAFALADGASRWAVPFERAMLTGLALGPAASVLVATAATDLLDGEGALAALDEAGEVRWRWAPGAQQISAPAVEGGLVYVTLDARTLVALDAHTGVERGRAALPVTASLAAPAIQGDTAYVPCRGPHLLAVTPEAGDLLWHFDTPDAPDVWFDRTPLVAESRLFAVTSGGTVLALNCRDGDLIWMADVGPLGRPLSAPAARQGDSACVYIGARDGLHALEMDDGGEVWGFHTARRISARPLVHDGLVYAVGHDHHLYALDAATGQKCWQYQTSRRIEVPPLRVPGRESSRRDGSRRDGSRFVVADRANLSAVAPPLSRAEPEPDAGGSRLWAGSERAIERAEALVVQARAKTAPRAAQAALWEEAAAIFAAEGEDARAEDCRQQQARCRRRPIIELEVETGPLLLAAWSTLRLTVRNVGFGPARSLVLRASGDAFEGQVASTQRILGLRAGRERVETLDVRPLEHGASVPLRVQVTYQDQAGQAHSEEQTLYIPVFRERVTGGAMSQQESYQRGLDQLQRRLPATEREDFEAYKYRLLDTFEQEKFGSTAALRAERARSIAGLNRLSLKYLDISFLDLCSQVDAWLSAQFRAHGPDFAPDPDAFALESDLREPAEAAAVAPLPSPEPFADMEIHILEAQRGGYPVDIELRDAQKRTIQTYERGYLRADLAAWKPTDNPVADGGYLFSALTTDAQLVRAWFHASGQAPRRRIRLRIDPAELHALPWELLHDGQVFVACSAQTPFSRFLPAPAAHEWSATAGPVRVLAVLSNPQDLEAQGFPRLEMAKEIHTLETLFPEPRFQMMRLDSPASPDALARALSDGCHILHYVGHGAVDGEGRAYLVMGAQNAQPLYAEQVRSMLANLGQPPRLVFLAACHSAQGTTTDAFLGLGPQLVRAGIPAVVAMQAGISAATARKLGEVFYERLARHGVVDLAMNEARATLDVLSRPDAAVPVLFMRLKDGGVLTRP